MSRPRPPHGWLTPAGAVVRSPFVVAVLELVEQVPAGRATPYGDLAGFLGTAAARAVGQVMSGYGHELPWQRVVLATGAPAPGHEREALALLRAEGCPLRPDGQRVDLSRARWSGPNCPTPVVHCLA